MHREGEEGASAPPGRAQGRWPSRALAGGTGPGAAWGSDGAAHVVLIISSSNLFFHWQQNCAALSDELNRSPDTRGIDRF